MNNSSLPPIIGSKYVYGIVATILSVVLLMAAFGPSLLAAASNGNEVESFELENLRVSGLTPSEVEAHIILVDTGTENVYVGVATGMTPGVPYVSLIYDTDSEEDGPEACEPGIDPDTPLTDEQMFIGFWVPIDSSIRTLEMHAIIGFDGPMPIFGPTQTSKTGAEFTPIDDIGTMSVREPPFMGPVFVLACGEID